MTTESFANDNSNQGTTEPTFNQNQDKGGEENKGSGNELQQQVDVMQKRLTDKDEFIDTLKTENQQFRERMADVEAKLQSMGSVEEAVARMQEANQSNQDTIYYKLSTKKESDFGYIRLTLVGATYPLIIQLTDSNGNIKYEKYTESKSEIDFLDLEPSKYSVRVIHDTNKNKKYDPGNFLKKIQPEKVSHFEMSENLRANWGLIESLNFK